VIKPRIENDFGCYPGEYFRVGKHPGGGWWADDDPSGPPSWMLEDQELRKREGFPCLYGKTGDRLWCRQNYLLLDEDLLPSDIDILYRLTDDRLYVILIAEVQNGRYKTTEWSPSQAHSNFPQRGLHGGVGRASLLTNKIQRLWAEGIRGLVSASRTQQQQRLSDHINVSSEPQGNQECSPSDMYGFSWDAPVPVISNTTLRRQSQKQSTQQPALGNSRRKLDGQKITRTRERRAKTSDGKTDRLRNESPAMGNQGRALQSAPSSEGTWDVAGWHLCSCPPELIKPKPSIFMPRWASRITLEITDIRIERVQDIAPLDCEKEGIIGSTHASPVRGQPYEEYLNGDGLVYTDPKTAFANLWDSINEKRGYPWTQNPWVWCISFSVLDKEEK